MRGHYRFLTTWMLDCEREAIWEAIYDSESWPRWWRGVVEVERLAQGDADGVGQRGRYVWRGAVPYPVEFEIRSTRVEHPHLLEGEATGGLEGVGRWHLLERATITVVLYEWNVRTTKRWMNLVGPLARPIFEANHDWVMRNGATGIAALLGCRLLAAD